MQNINDYISENDWGDTWNPLTVGALPVFVWCAINKEKVTYAGLNKYLYKNKISSVNYIGASVNYMGHPAGHIGGYLIKNKLPLLNALLVNAVTKIPGKGIFEFIGEHLNKKELSKYKKLKPSGKRAFLNDYIWPIIYSYNWNEFIKVNNIDIGKINENDFLVKENVKSKSLKSKLKKIKEDTSSCHRGAAEESPEHKALKDLVVKNIKNISTLHNLKFKKDDAILEYILPSADKIDILFQSSQGSVGVEVKSFKSDDSDLYRGIYQCVKYKYLLQAELLEAGELPYAESILIVQRKLPPVLKELAKRFNIKWYVL